MSAASNNWIKWSVLALVLLFWPLISKGIALIKPPKKPDEFAVERPVD